MKNTWLYFILLPLMLGAYFPLFSQVQYGEEIIGDAAGDSCGSALAISADGHIIATGSPHYDGNGTNAGRVRVFEQREGEWAQLGADIEGDSALDYAGYSVALSADGKRVAVGNPTQFQPEKGIVKVYDWDGSNWIRVGSPVVGRHLSDKFGRAVALSADGNRLAINAPYDSTGGYGFGTGVVRVYEWSNIDWVQIGEDLSGKNAGDLFGSSIAFSADGKRIAANVPYPYWGNQTRDYVRVYEWSPGVMGQVGSWDRMGDDIEVEGWIGRNHAISISGDGSRLAFTTRGNDDYGRDYGQVRVFRWERTTSTWALMGNIMEPEGTKRSFGACISLSGAGDRLAVGAPFDISEKGTVRIYEWTGAAWLQAGANIYGRKRSHFSGNPLAFSANGQWVIIGSPYQNRRGTHAGGARVFYLGKLSRRGKIRYDEKGMCEADSTAPGLSNAHFYFTQNGERTFAFSDAEGNYRVLLDPGRYTVSFDHSSLNHAPYLYHAFCENTTSVSVDSNEFYGTIYDLVVKPEFFCPYLSVDISCRRIVRCFTGMYDIVYSNTGTREAENAYVEIALDPNLSYTGSSIPLRSNVGNQLRFELGTLAVDEQGAFNIHVKENCKTDLGHIHCTTAHIYPDSMCREDLPQARVSSSCQHDTLVLHLSNPGGNFEQALPYLILDQTAIKDTGSIYLQAKESTTIYFPIDSVPQGYQFVMAPQDPPRYMATGLLGCDSTLSNSNLAFLPQMSHRAEQVNCTSSTGSFDPNDKQGFPIGSGPDHYLMPYTPLEYMIRFQNTGTDTAYFINILDTLSTHLDATTLFPGTSSHPYRFEIMPSKTSGRSIIHFEFDPIFLPDSGANQDGSNGFVKYKIQMKRDLPLGTVLENRAAIYFDFNEPVITNTVVHTLHIPVFDIEVPPTLAEAIWVYPNPTTGTLHINLGEKQEGVFLSVSDVLGNILLEKKYAELTRTQIELDEPEGIYFIRIKTQGGFSAVKKIVVR